MMNTLLAAIAFLSINALAHVLASGQAASSGEIYGVIAGWTGGNSSTTVELRAADNGAVIDTVIVLDALSKFYGQATASFRFTNLKAGTYFIRMDYQRVMRRVVSVRAGESSIVQVERLPICPPVSGGQAELSDADMAEVIGLIGLGLRSNEREPVLLLPGRALDAWLARLDSMVTPVSESTLQALANRRGNVHYVALRDISASAHCPSVTVHSSIWLPSGSRAVVMCCSDTQYTFRWRDGYWEYDVVLVSVY
jgi:hypothetical protein